MKIPIALQLYSIRTDCAQDFLGCIAQVAQMGYEGVEFAGYHGVDPKDIKKCLDDNGLKAEGTHTALHLLEGDELAKTVELHKTLDCPWAIVPWLPEESRSTPDACLKTAERLSVVVEKLKPYGMKTGFHAHDGDMRPLPGGKSAWTLIAENTPPEFIMQYDTANGVAGGADPVQPILDLPGRNLSVHLKEYKDGHGTAVLGEGDIPLAKVFKACESGGGVQWYVVEHESEVLMPPLQAVALCLQNLRKLGK